MKLNKSLSPGSHPFFRHSRLGVAFFLILLGAFLSTNQTVQALISGHAVGGGPQSNAGFVVRQPAAITNGLVAYYPLDGNANDVSGSGNNGALTNFKGSPTDGYKAGKFGNALTFDGVSDYVSSSNVVTNDTTTYSAWVNLSGTNFYPQIISAPSRELRFYSGTSQPEMICDQSVHNFSNSSVSLNSWHFLVGICNGTTESIYVDGILQASRSFTANGSTVGINIGKRGGGNYFNGSIDDVRIYNRALSASEITTLYQGSSPENCDQYCVGWWKLDGTSGTTEDSQYSYTYGPQGSTTGKYGTALQFSGADYATSASNATNPTTFSYSAWFNTVNGGLIMRFGTNTFDRTLYVGNDGKVYFAVTAGSNISSTASYTDGTWHHVAATYSSGTGNLYMDGSLVASSGSMATPINFTSLWYVGYAFLSNGVPSTPVKNYQMTLDDVRIYSTALVQSDVTTLYTAVSPPTCTTGCLAYWNLNETSGTSGADGSGNSNTLSLVANPTPQAQSFSFTSQSTNRLINRATLSNATFGTNSTSGVFGNALTFNGTSSKVTSSTPVFGGSLSDFTNLTWFKTSAVSGSLISSGDCNSYYSVLFLDSSGKIGFYVNGSYLLSTSAYNDGAWHSVAATLSATGGSYLYVDGVMVANNPNMKTIQSSIFSWNMGCSVTPGGNGGWYNGSLDDMRIYSRALSANEIYVQYSAGR